jgi:hypothetical protein
MAPYIFILCMDIILQQLNPEWGAVIENEFELNEFTGEVEHLHGRRGRRLPRRLSNCAYSDDVVLLCNSTQHAQLQFSRFEEVAASFGMRINLGAGKTEEIRLNAPKDDPPLKNAAGDAIGQVDNYKYLGTALGKSWREDFDRRRQLAWGVCSKYKHIWSARTGMDNKYKLFQALVEPVLLYGALTYPDLADVRERLHATHGRLLRHCLGLPRADPSKPNHKVTEWLYLSGNDDSYKELGRSYASATLTLPAKAMRQGLSALGHWVRDHFYREHLGEADRNRKHPVIEVLRFSPSVDKYGKKRGVSTLRDSYQSAVRSPNWLEPPSYDVLRNEVCCPTDSLCLDKHQWYNRSKYRVKEEDCDILHKAIHRRWQDPNRYFNRAEYLKVKKQICDHKRFTHRHLTRRSRQNPLGEDIQLVKEMYRNL